MDAVTDDALPPPPISDAAPCGPDLDMEGDAEFMNFMAATEGQLPSSFFAFDRKSIAFADVVRAAGALTQRTQDLRLYVLLAKLAILDRSLEGFAGHLATIGALLKHRWDDVHPRGEGGDFASRLAHLSTLDDGPVIVLPLQYAPLLDTSRDGAVVFRSQLVALEEANLREGETFPSASTVDRILAQCELSQIEARLAAARAIQGAVAAIEGATREHAGYENGITLKALGPLIGRIGDFLQGALAKRDPNVAAPAPPATEGSAPSAGKAVEAAPAPGAFASLADVDAALGQAHAYFLTREPSNPALMLVGQARQSLGKTLYEVMLLLAPNHADAARVMVGRDSPFPVPVKALAETPSPEMERATPEPAPSRAAAFAIMDAVAAHMRVSEPSSPAPLLLERAKALASRDFLGLLGELLPEDALNAMKGGS